MNTLLISALLSMLPLTELRLSIPYAMAQNANPTAVFIICVMANIAVIFPIFLFLDYVHTRALKIRGYAKISSLFLRRIRLKAAKVERQMQIYGYLALAGFVAIPLPITGAYTGTIIAWLLNLKRKKSFFAIASGVAIAGIIVTLASLGIINSLG